MLGQQSNAERQDGSSTSSKSCRKSNNHDVLVAREDLVGDEDDAWEERAQEEALEGDGDDGDVELGDKPEDELKGHGGGDVGLNGRVSVSFEVSCLENIPL